MTSRTFTRLAGASLIVTATMVGCSGAQMEHRPALSSNNATGIATGIEKALQSRDFARALLDHLDGRERRILCLRHGIGTDHEWTLEEIGAALGVTRERVRQLEGIALQKLRTEAAARPAA